MALDKDSLKGRIVSNMVSAGANAQGEHSWVEKMAEAIAEAVIDEVTENAQVEVTTGNSAGTYNVS